MYKNICDRGIDLDIFEEFIYLNRIFHLFRQQVLRCRVSFQM